jgi:DNA-binding protein WhiA
MSYSSKVRDELTGKISPARHCQLAELAAITHFCGQIGRTDDGICHIGFVTEKETLVKKGFTLLKKTFNIDSVVGITPEKLQDILAVLGDFDEPVNPLLLKNSCCQRAFLRGAFLSVGSVSDPTKGYHLEFVCPDEEKAEQIRSIIGDFDIDARVITRKKYHVVYLKEGNAIVDLLNVMEAPISLMELVNTQIYKDVSNTVNRRVNCEISNIRKTVTASARQIEDIEIIRTRMGLDRLPAPLREMAEVRLENPDASLKDLGECMDPPVGKSGVNHRLRKLSEIADSLRD